MVIKTYRSGRIKSFFKITQIMHAYDDVSVIVIIITVTKQVNRYVATSGAFSPIIGTTVAITS